MFSEQDHPRNTVGMPPPSTFSGGGEAVLDLAYLHEVSGGDKAFMCELAAEFFATVPELLSRLDGALRSSDFPTAGRTVHNLKGCCRSFGAVGMSAVCVRLEESLSEGVLDLSGLFEELLVCFHEVQEFVELNCPGVRASLGDAQGDAA